MVWCALAWALLTQQPQPAPVPPATIEAAQALEAAGEDDAALAMLQAVIARQPAWEIPRLEAARLLLKLGREPERAELEVEIALALAPDNPRAHFLTAELAQARGETREAARALERALIFRPDYPEARLQLGAIYAAQGDWLHAEHHYRKLAREHPELTQGRLQLALALEQQGRVADAEVVLAQLLADEPENAWLKRRAAEFYERTGQATKAASLLAPLRRGRARRRCGRSRSLGAELRRAARSARPGRLTRHDDAVLHRVEQQIALARDRSLVHCRSVVTPFELLVQRLSEFLGEPNARSTVNSFCKQKVGVAPAALSASQLNLVLPSFKPMLSILIGTTHAEALLARISSELSR